MKKIELLEETGRDHGYSFKDIRAYTTSFAGDAFFKKVPTGDLLEAIGLYNESRKTVYVGLSAEGLHGPCENILLLDAITISPDQLRRAFEKAETHNREECVALVYYQAITFHADLLSTMHLEKDLVRSEINLEELIK